MGHIVVFEGSDQVPTYHRCEELAEAVSFVEKLRNDRGIESAQIFRAEEVRFDFRPYYRVELGSAPAVQRPISSAATAPAPAPAPVSVPTMVAAPPSLSTLAPAPSEPPTSSSPSAGAYAGDDDISVGTGVRRGLFGR